MKSVFLAAMFFLTACSPNPNVDLPQKQSSTSSAEVYPENNTGLSSTPSNSGTAASCNLSAMKSPSSNEQFINLAYCQILQRPPDSAGYSYWWSQLASGYPRANLLVSFAMSAENPFKPANSTAAQVASYLYSSYLNRAADSAGADSWANRYTQLNGDFAALSLEFLSNVEPKNYWLLP